MNEGKPTKAKWWSRPRPQAPAGPAEGHAADGDFELARPGAVQQGSAGPEGDYELERPAAARSTDEGDYELDRPVAAGSGRTEPSAGPSGADLAVTVEGDRSGSHTDDGAAGAAGPETGEVRAAAPADRASGDGDAGAAAPAVAAAGDAVAAAPAGDEPGDAIASASGAAPAVEHPKPLHDPDPYSTPPYGEPGPWAPAPPVQHPAAHLPPPVSGTPVPPSVGVPGAAGAHGVPAPPVPLAPGSVTPPPPVPGTPVPPPVGTPSAAGAHAPVGPQATPTPVPDSTQASPVLGTSGPSHTAAPDLAQPPAPNPWQRYDPWAAPSAPAPLQQNGAVVLSTRQRRARVKKLLVGGAVLLALVSGGLGGVVGTYLERNGGVGTVELPQAGKEPAGRAPDSVAGIAARALPSVVTLHVSGAGEQGTGTGFVLDTSGHILTNDHVVEPAGDDGEISVTFNSGDTAKATVVGRDSGYDLAVVRVSGVRGLTPLPLGNSDNVQVGDPVVAIGAPFDLAGTVTSGIISAKERPITAGGEKGDGSDVSYVDALQTDAPINPGNSGGPLLDSKARVIGINSAIRSAGSGSDPDGGQAGSIGLGFAIPINQGKRVAEELIDTGHATHPVIGITLDMNYTGDGARVGTKSNDGGPPVTTGGPGDKAGIKAGDVITEVDGQRVHSGEELIVKTRAHRPGDRLELTLRRDGKERTVSLVLGSSGGR
ncbi:trypsin-like peptidase domain-containing protein [Streptomyces sp. S.PNR 29]|uniref:S1C family serine protease n=1 Tax=Streptomyces sp. S.PNR 29 TaxID=2973805 RepID=UPI0025B1317A|nr:trypsin-like peptidase domain-containing protein [Streptomyces sp. S.PNR 29]MDN0195573.1 trypsin-like peptidase domain-containing protein [Streptomyces sp. S.PNR 29]